MKRHCCNDDRRCCAVDCDSEEANCECGCTRCGNAVECEFPICKQAAVEQGHCAIHHELLTNTAGT